MWQALSIVLIAAHVVEPCLPSGDAPNYSRDDRNLTAEEISNKLISVNLHFEAELDERMLGKTKLKIGVTQNPLTTNCQGYNAQSQLHDFIFHCDIIYPNVTLELIELKGIFASDGTFRRLPHDRFKFVETDMPATAQYRWQRVEGQPTTVRLEKISLKESSVAFAKKVNKMILAQTRPWRKSSMKNLDALKSSAFCNLHTTASLSLHQT